MDPDWKMDPLKMYFLLKILPCSFYRSVSTTLLVYSAPSATKSQICSAFVGEKGCISLEFGKIVSFSDGTGKTPALL